MGSRWAPGQRFGPEFAPEQYQLLEFRHRGGEAEVWRAERRGHNGLAEQVAAKIMHQRAPADVKRWWGRWDDVSHNAHRLGIADLVVPSFFLGRPPHEPGTDAGPGPIGYQISPWLDAVPLNQWAAANRHGPAAAAQVLIGLCRIVDQLHDRRWVHRDISAANVLVDQDDARVSLIDLTFLAPLDHALTIAVFTPGHTPPEGERVGQLPTIGKDVFAVGTVARALLLPHHGPLDESEPVETTRVELLAAGYSESVVDWLTRPLQADPRARPAPLSVWAEQGRELLSPLRTVPRVGALTAVVDRAGRPLVVSGTATGIRVARAEDGDDAGRLTLPPPGGPRGARELVAGANPDGAVAVFALDRSARLWLGESRGWDEVSHGVSGLAGYPDAAGGVTAWTASAGVICGLHCRPDRELTLRELPDCRAERVLDACEDGPFTAAVLVEHRGRLVVWRITTGDDAESERLPRLPGGAPVLSARIARAAGGLQVGAVLADGSTVVRDGAAGPDAAWRPVTDAEPGGGSERVLHAAALGHRGGPTWALAGPGGVRLRIQDAAGTRRRPRWWRPTLRPATAVTLTQSDDWRLTLAAVVEDELHCWQEDASHRWRAVPMADAD